MRRLREGHRRHQGNEDGESQERSRGGVATGMAEVPAEGTFAARWQFPWGVRGHMPIQPRIDQDRGRRGASRACRRVRLRNARWLGADGDMLPTAGALLVIAEPIVVGDGP